MSSLAAQALCLTILLVMSFSVGGAVPIRSISSAASVAHSTVPRSDATAAANRRPASKRTVTAGRRAITGDHVATSSDLLKSFGFAAAVDIADRTVSGSIELAASADHVTHAPVGASSKVTVPLVNNKNPIPGAMDSAPSDKYFAAAECASLAVQCSADLAARSGMCAPGVWASAQPQRCLAAACRYCVDRRTDMCDRAPIQKNCNTNNKKIGPDDNQKKAASGLHETSDTSKTGDTGGTSGSETTRDTGDKQRGGSSCLVRARLQSVRICRRPPRVRAVETPAGRFTHLARRRRNGDR